jgi:hypothetical protein
VTLTESYLLGALLASFGSMVYVIKFEEEEDPMIVAWSGFAAGVAWPVVAALVGLCVVGWVLRKIIRLF